MRALMARKRAEMARSAEIALFVVRAVMARYGNAFRIEKEGMLCIFYVLGFVERGAFVCVQIASDV